MSNKEDTRFVIFLRRKKSIRISYNIICVAFLCELLSAPVTQVPHTIENSITFFRSLLYIVLNFYLRISTLLIFIRFYVKYWGYDFSMEVGSGPLLGLNKHKKVLKKLCHKYLMTAEFKKKLLMIRCHSL